MDVGLLNCNDPTDPRYQKTWEFYPTSPTGHYLRLISAIILTALHLTPTVITHPDNHDAILFVQPYITKWLMVPYAVYYTAFSHHVLVEASWGSWAVGYVDTDRLTNLLITDPRTIIHNLRVGMLTYLICGVVLMCDALYLWTLILVPAMWNSLPPYRLEDWELELKYALVVVGVIVTLLLGPVLVVVLVLKAGWRLGKEARKVEHACWERLELEKRIGEQRGES